MQEYLKNILKRVQRYSKELDTIELFVDKKWVYIDKSGKHQFTFLRDKRLLMSLNGITKTGSWELLPTKQLFINRISVELILEKFFIQNALLALKLSGSDDEPFVLINEDEIPDLDVPKYLERFEEQKNASLVNEQGDCYLKSNGELSGSRFYEGMVIKMSNGMLLNGVYKTSRSDVAQYVELSNNYVKRLYFLVRYTYNDLDIILQQRDCFNLQVGDKVLLDASIFIPINTHFTILSYDERTYKISCKNDGEIKTVSPIWNTIDILLFALIAVILIVGIIILAKNH